MTEAMPRLIILFFDTVPASQQVLDLLQHHKGVTGALLARLDDTSRRAAMWTRDPMDCLPQGRLALDITDIGVCDALSERLVDVVGGVAYRCRTHVPITPQLEVGVTFEGTLQLCCFQRVQGLSDSQLAQYWLNEHTGVAITTQNTLGYQQNWVLQGGDPCFDGIVEEYFPSEASDSMTAFFADGHDEALMWGHIQRLTDSSERFLDLERAEVIHLTDTRIL